MLFLSTSSVNMSIYVYILKDMLQAFDDFRSKQLKCIKKCFLICRSAYILKVYSIHYTFS